MTKKIMKTVVSALVASLLISTTAFAGNKDFQFLLINSNSAESLLGKAQKDYDGDQNAYVTPKEKLSNLVALNATVNVRVRDDARNYATEYRECSAYRRYVLPYLSGKAIGGNSYRLYANVERTNKYPVSVNGAWCP